MAVMSGQDKGVAATPPGAREPNPQAVSALRALPPNAANDRCTCAEVYGEDPDCALHGVETKWAVENTMPWDWQQTVIEYREMLADETARSGALADTLKQLIEAVEPGASRRSDFYLAEARSVLSKWGGR